MDDNSRAEWLRRCAAKPGQEWRLRARRGDAVVELSNEGTFDELVVDHWLHVEQLDERAWWMRVGDARLAVAVAADGTVTLDVTRGFYDEITGATGAVDSAGRAQAVGDPKTR